MKLPTVRRDDVTRGTALLALVAFVATALSHAGVLASLLTAFVAALTSYNAWRTLAKAPESKSPKTQPVRTPAARLEAYLTDASETMRALRMETESECEAAASALSKWRIAQAQVREARALKDAVTAASDVTQALTGRLTEALATSEGVAARLAASLVEMTPMAQARQVDPQQSAHAMTRELASSVASVAAAEEKRARLDEPLTGFRHLAAKVSAINADLQLLAVNATLLARRKAEGQEIERLGESARDVALRLDALAHATADLVAYVETCEGEARACLAECKAALVRVQREATPLIDALEAGRKTQDALSVKLVELKEGGDELSASLTRSHEIALGLADAVRRWVDEDLAFGRAVGQVDQILAAQKVPVEDVERIMRRQIATLGQYAERLGRIEQELIESKNTSEPLAPPAAPDAALQASEDDEFERMLVGAVDQALAEPKGPTLDLAAVRVAAEGPSLALPLEGETAS